jgi:hypothetical protein
MLQLRSPVQSSRRAIPRFRVYSAANGRSDWPCRAANFADFVAGADSTGTTYSPPPDGAIPDGSALVQFRAHWSNSAHS